ncbi:hypothetical protein ACLKA7_001843 [Drosophila subpalustris]
MGRRLLKVLHGEGGRGSGDSVGQDGTRQKGACSVQWTWSQLRVVGNVVQFARSSLLGAVDVVQFAVAGSSVQQLGLLAIVGYHCSDWAADGRGITSAAIRAAGNRGVRVELARLLQLVLLLIVVAVV